MDFDKEKMIAWCNDWSRNTLMETLEIKYIDAGKDFLKASMPVNPRVHQPMGLLHGGASAALAESVGSAASILFIDLATEEVRGIEVTANHIKSKRSGMIYGTARIIHRGRNLHLWEIRITDENESLVSLCKLTNIVLPKKTKTHAQDR
ncbi:MAG: PaaI family thioesterase [Flavobacterium sp.]|nr:MAG: PaaI family thioesterase [Flavobacterium sp.]